MLQKKHEEFFKNLSLEDFAKLTLLKKYGAKIDREIPAKLESLVKRTSLNSILGLKRPSNGMIRFGTTLLKKSPEDFARITGEPYPAKVTDRVTAFAKAWGKLPEDQKKVNMIFVA